MMGVRGISLALTMLLAVGCGAERTAAPKSAAPTQSAVETVSAAPALTPTAISLDGAWDFRTINGVYTNAQATDAADGAWRSINTPANWFLEGVDHQGVAIYRKTIDLPSLQTGQSAWLNFDGVDYAADIWVNDQFVGSHQGYFQYFDFDVTRFLNEGENTVHVAVNSPKEDVRGVWSLRKQLIKGIFNHHDTRPGGAWSDRGQEQNTGGIWAPVSLKIVGPAAIRDLALAPTYDDAQLGQLALDFESVGDSAADIDKIVIRLTPKNFAGESVFIEKSMPAADAAGRRRLEIEHGEIELWWPFDLGAPNLYELEIKLLVDGVVSDSVRRAFGYRRVEHNVESGEWRINGKRLFLRGTNYIATQWLSEMSPEKYAIDLGMMRTAHINIVRVHAHIGAQEFYDAADEMGMLVWQDFPLQWGYDDGPDFLREAKRQSLDMVRQFHDHPSIIAWSMQNEPPWDADWMKWKYPDYDPAQNRRLTEALYETVKAADATRYTHSHSATAEHPWLGWYSGSWRDYAKPTDQTIVSEFGAQALPDLDGLRRIFPEDAIWPDSEEDWALWAYHNFQKHELTNIAGVEIGDSIEEFIENTQSYQATVTKYAAEALRRQKYQPVGAAFQFLFNEDWPSINWGIVDYWRTPKPAYNALKIAYQPILASLEWTQDSFEPGDTVEVGVWLINDLHQQYPGAVYEISLRTPSALLEPDEYFVSIEPDSIEKIATWRKGVTETGPYSMVARVRSKDGVLLSVNEYQFTVADSAPRLTQAPR